MLPRSPLTQLVPERLNEVIGRIQALIWEPTEHAVSIEAGDSRKEHVPFARASEEALQAVDSLPETWGRMWEQRWFRLTLPETAFAEGLYLFWDDEAEATLYADGTPWFGIDAAHHHAPLPTEAKELWVEGVVCRTGVWCNDGKAIGPEGSTLRGAGVWRRNEAAWECYHDLRVLLDLCTQEFRRYMEPQDDADGYARNQGYHQPTFTISPLYRRILAGLDRFADAFDNTGLAAAPLLKTIYEGLPANAASLDAILTGHAHIDLVWLWPERVGEAKALHTFATVNRLMAIDPELHFGYSQPASYDAVARRSPELMEQVRARIGEGRWEATGASDVESDTQLPCGEALARSFIIGQKRFEAIRGEPASVMWLPDVFGYSGCVPQILRQVGVSGFYTSKTAWSGVNRFPYSSFRWRGPDGSEVLVHLGQEPGYNGGLHLNHLRTLEECQQQAGVHNEVLVPTGYGDGGGGPTFEMLERAKRLRNLSGMPRCEWGRIEDFFARMADVGNALPEWRGELYLEYHRGVQTTMGGFKAVFRAAERALQRWEAVHAVSGQGPVSEAAWRRLIFCQFHDAIPGSSIHEVYEELTADLEARIEESDTAVGDRLASGEPVALFNPLPFAVETLRDGRIHRLPALGSALIADGREPEDTVEVSEGCLENDRLKARFNALGELTRMEVDGRALALTEPGNQLWLYPDHPHCFPAWEIDRGTLGNGSRAEAGASCRIELASGTEGVLAYTRKLGKASTATVRYRLEAESDFLQMEWEIDWGEPETLLKAVFPSAYNGKMARYGAPFGSTLRPQHPGEERAEAMFEVPGSRWALLSDDGEEEGLALITEAKYGFSAREGTIGLSLLRSPKITDGEKNRALRTLADPRPHSDLGRSVIRAAITLHRSGLPRENQPAALAERLFQKPLPASTVPDNPFRFEIEGAPSLLPVWAQPLKDGACVIRCTETMGRRGEATVSVADGVTVEVVDLMGRPMDDPRVDAGCLQFKPYQLFGLKLSLK